MINLKNMKIFKNYLNLKEIIINQLKSIIIRLYNQSKKMIFLIFNFKIYKTYTNKKKLK